MKKVSNVLQAILILAIIFIALIGLSYITKAEEKTLAEKTITLFKSENECCSIIMTQHWEGEFQLTDLKYIDYRAGDGKSQLDSIHRISETNVEEALNRYMEYCYKYHH